MACNKFETIGLLYVYGELGEDEAKVYESHLADCPECAGEVEAYKNERAELYTADVLSEDPPPEVDAEILRVCASAKAVRAPVFMPMMFIRKYAAVPVFAMLVMVAIGGYVKYHSMNAGMANGQAAGAVAATSEQNASNDDTTEPVVADSVTDEEGRALPRRGNLDMPGVFTVSGE